MFHFLFMQQLSDLILRKNVQIQIFSAYTTYVLSLLQSTLDSEDNCEGLIKYDIQNVY
jgi:hypothetical protein